MVWSKSGRTTTSFPVRPRISACSGEISLPQTETPQTVIASYSPSTRMITGRSSTESRLKRKCFGRFE